MASTLVPGPASNSEQSKRSRRIPDCEWDVKRQDLERLFLEHNKSRKDIVDIMAKDHNFVFTEIQLKRRFEKWGVRKYIPESDWKAILSMKRKLPESETAPHIQWRGRGLEPARVERRTKRQKGPVRSPELIPNHINVSNLSHQISQSPARTPSIENGNWSSFFDSDNGPLISESQIVHRYPDFGININMNSSVKLPLVSESCGVADLTFCGHHLNDNLMPDARILTPKQSTWNNLSRYIPMETEMDLVNCELPATTQGSEPHGMPDALQISTSRSPSPAVIDWDSFLNSPLLSNSPISGSPVTTSSPRHGARRTSIGFNGIQISSPEVSSETSSVQTVSGQVELFKDVNLEHFSKPLLLVQDMFFSCLSQISMGQSLETTQAIIEWMKCEFDNLLVASLEATASSVRKRSANRDITEPNLRLSSHSQNSQAVPTEGVVSSSREVRQRLRWTQKSTQTAYFHDPSVGHLSFKLTASSSQNSSRITTASFSFTPTCNICTTGVSAELIQTFDEIRCPSIIRNPQVFNVLKYDHPILEALYKNDVGKVQQLLSSRQIFPNDRIEDGNSLFYYATSSLDLVKLLLREGASAQDTGLHPSGALYFMWITGMEWMFHAVDSEFWCPPRQFDYFRQISEAALEAGACIDECQISYDQTSRQSDGLIERSIEYALDQENVIDQLQLVVAYLIKIGCAVDHRNSSGRTAFLYAAEFSGRPTHLLLRMLLDQGANAMAKDARGRGALHLAIINCRRCKYYIAIEGDAIFPENEDDSALSGGYHGQRPGEHPGEYFRENPGDLDSNESSPGKDASDLDSSNESALSCLSPEDASTEQNTDIQYDVDTLSDSDSSEPMIFEDEHGCGIRPWHISLQLLKDKLLLLLQMGCDPWAEDNEGRSVCQYAERMGVSSTWHAALMAFEAEKETSNKEENDSGRKRGNETI